MLVWCEDEAGPYQAVPPPGASWQPEGKPAHQPHEYIRGGTAKLLTLFHPATGELRAQPVLQAPNAVLPPWLKAELAAILAPLPPVLDPQAPGRRWQDWGWSEAEVASWEVSALLPPVRMLLVWDNLRGHKTPEIVDWCVHHGILPLYTPMGGSWLNMAESVQRIVGRRALTGQHPESAATVMEWLGAAVAGWNREPTPLAWGGKRAARGQRARERGSAGIGWAARAPTPGVASPSARNWRPGSLTLTVMTSDPLVG